jgi:hypothetical protein
MRIKGAKPPVHNLPDTEKKAFGYRGGVGLLRAPVG